MRSIVKLVVVAFLVTLDHSLICGNNRLIDNFTMVTYVKVIISSGQTPKEHGRSFCYDKFWLRFAHNAYCWKFVVAQGFPITFWTTRHGCFVFGMECNADFWQSRWFFRRTSCGRRGWNSAPLPGTALPIINNFIPLIFTFLIVLRCAGFSFKFLC